MLSLYDICHQWRGGDGRKLLRPGAGGKHGPCSPVSIHVRSVVSESVRKIDVFILTSTHSYPSYHFHSLTLLLLTGNYQNCSRQPGKSPTVF